jgi:hypothetical protein
MAVAARAVGDVDRIGEAAKALGAREQRGPESGGAISTVTAKRPLRSAASRPLAGSTGGGASGSASASVCTGGASGVG